MCELMREKLNKWTIEWMNEWMGSSFLRYRLSSKTSSLLTRNHSKSTHTRAEIEVFFSSCIDTNITVTDCLLMWVTAQIDMEYMIVTRTSSSKWWCTGHADLPGNEPVINHKFYYYDPCLSQWELSKWPYSLCLRAWLYIN